MRIYVYGIYRRITTCGLCMFSQPAEGCADIIPCHGKAIFVIYTGLYEGGDCFILLEVFYLVLKWHVFAREKQGKCFTNWTSLYPFFLLYEMYVCSYCIITTTIISGSSGVLDLDIQKYNRFFPKFKWSPFLTLFLPHELKLQNYIIFCETLFAVYTKTIMLLSISRCNFPKWPSRNSTTMVSSK